MLSPPLSRFSCGLKQLPCRDGDVEKTSARNEFATSRSARQATGSAGRPWPRLESRSRDYKRLLALGAPHPGAVKYITCRVMSFRPWQSSVGPLRGLSCLRGGIALILSIPTMTRPASPFISSIFLSPRSASVFGDFLFGSFHPRLPPPAFVFLPLPS